MLYEIIKIKSEYPERENLSLRLTTLIKRFRYNNSIISAIIKKKIKKSAKELENRKLINIRFKTADLYNPGEQYEGESYDLVKENVNKIERNIIKPNYLFNRIIGILLNVFITAFVILLVYLFYVLLNENFGNQVKSFFQSEDINRTLGIICNLLFICGVPFSIVTYFTSKKTKSNT